MVFLKKLMRGKNLRRVLYERLTEPIHLNVLSAFVAVFGTFRQKVACDLVLRHQHAYGLLKAADQAKQYGLPALSVIEFGVASGGGLLNLSFLAEKISALTGVKIDIYGFDTGKGMPRHRDYRDHPDLYQEGDFAPDLAGLKRRLPANARLVLGELAGTVPQFVRDELSAAAPLGYVCVDVDYYSSTVDALKVFDGPAGCYLPMVGIYLDDVEFEAHNPYAGELLAVNEFNQQHEFRKICRYEFLECNRIFRNAAWLKHMYILQVMDHAIRQSTVQRPAAPPENPYL